MSDRLIIGNATHSYEVQEAGASCRKVCNMVILMEYVWIRKTASMCITQVTRR